MRPHGSPEQLEQRRRKAVALLEANYALADVARRVAMHPQSVRRLWRRYQAEGEAALAARKASGRPPELTPQQRNGLVQRLRQGARAEGYANDLWTARRVQQLIERRYGVHYHPNHVAKLLNELGFSPSETGASRRRTR